MIEILNNPIKVLMCFFAMPRENWEQKYDAYKNNVEDSVSLNITTEMAMPSTFIKQCNECDVILISGGDDNLLKCMFSQFDIPKIWDNNVVVTSSASSNYISESFWTCDWRLNMDGRGIVPIKFIPHYKSDTYGKDDTRGPIDWEQAYKDLESYGNVELPIHALKEGDFVVFDK